MIALANARVMVAVGSQCSALKAKVSAQTIVRVAASLSVTWMRATYATFRSINALTPVFIVDKTMTNPASPVDDARVPTMQERAANVAEDLERFFMNTKVSKLDQLDNLELQAGVCKTIATAIRALSPDPTRAALEECVRAAALDIWSAYERHLGNPAHANQDKDAFVLNVSAIIKQHVGA